MFCIWNVIVYYSIVQEIVHFEQCLGLPSLVGRRKKEGFNFIKEKIWRKLQGWEGKLLSQAGREVLTKAVIQVIPTYAMGCFKLPLGLCHEIETMIRKFWWGQRGEKRKIHWLKWDELIESKLEGVWDLETLPCSMIPCWQNKLGDS